MTTPLKSSLLSLAASLLLAACGHNGGPTAPDAGPDAGPQADGGSDAGPLPDGGPVPHDVKVRAIFPGSGPTTGGGTALVSGSGFVEGFAARGGGEVSKRTLVRVGGAAATSVDVIDDNRLELTLPAGAPGAADVQVTNPNGTGACAGCYRYVTPVEVLSIEPASGPSAGGTAVTVHGKGFAPGTLVTLGGSELIGFALVDAQTATGRTPPGAAGGADLLAITRDGRGQLRRGFVYVDPLRLDFIDPGAAATAGGTRVTLLGSGFTARTQVAVDSAAPPIVEWVDANHLSVVVQAHAAGAVDVAVTEAGATATARRSLVYVDAGAPFSLLAVEPAHGPLAGGTCPGPACVRLLGSGLTGAAVTIGGAAATVHPRDDRQLDVDLPAGAAPGLVDVAVTAGGATQTLAQAFRYDPPLAVASIAPAAGPAAGGTSITVAGAGLAAAGLTLRIGALETPFVAAADGRSLTAVTPAGSPGPADVVVTSGALEARLARGFVYTAPLALAQIAPALGAQAGGTRVSLYGRGFAPGLSASIGGASVVGLRLVSPTEATALTPPGLLGARPVAVALAGATDTLPAGFSYYDPASQLGGGTGGPLLGVLNVTALEASAFKNGGVPGATVAVVLHDGGKLEGLTDLNGQITFSDDRLVLPSQVTIAKAQYDAITVAAVQTANLTVYLSGPAGPPPPPPDPPPPPPPPPTPASVSGRVTGFKLPPSLVLSAKQRAVARVSIARPGIYALPPFATPPQFVTVDADGGSFTFAKLYSLSPTTFYAVFGIEDASTTPPSFEPMLLGVRRAVQPDPKAPVTDADIILDTHLDQTVDATVLSPPTAAAGTIGHDAFVDLDLGSAGAIPLGRVLQNSDLQHLRFRHLPQAAGQGFVFVDQVGQWTSSGLTLPVTRYLRRVFGDVSGGVALGPLLPFPSIAQAPFDGTLSWTLGPSPLQPNLQQVRLDDAGWQAVLPGDARSVTLPPFIRSRLAPGTHAWSITASTAPGFDFAHWNYDDLYSGSWTAYAFADGTFKVAP